jgi:DNA transformation protein and related proteins
MAAPLPDFVLFCCELMAKIGTISARRMFGAYGLACEGLNVALISADTLYLKVDADTLPQFEKAGGAPFRYGKSDGQLTAMSYWTVPTEAMESPAEMTHWARLAFAAAKRADAKKTKPSTKKPPRSA